MRRSPNVRALLTLAALASGCGDDLAPAWKLQSFRILGAKIENTSRPLAPSSAEAAPGETVRLVLETFDPATTPRTIQVVWVFCARARRTGNTLGCDPSTASVLMGNTVEYTVPRIEFGSDPFNRARVQGVAIACAGGTLGLDPATMLPRCDGPGAESWTMTRSVLVRTDPSAAENHNPVITEAAFYRVGDVNQRVVIAGDGTTRVPRCSSVPCPAWSVEVGVSPESREPYATFDNTGTRVERPERLVIGFFADKGEMDSAFRVDTPAMPMGPVRNTWILPREPGRVQFVFTAQDPRGGFDLVRRTVTVE